MNKERAEEPGPAPETESSALEAQKSRAARLRKLIEEKLETGDQPKPGPESPRDFVERNTPRET